MCLGVETSLVLYTLSGFLKTSTPFCLLHGQMLIYQKTKSNLCHKVLLANVTLVFPFNLKQCVTIKDLFNMIIIQVQCTHSLPKLLSLSPVSPPFLLELPDGTEHFISGLRQGESSSPVRPGSKGPALVGLAKEGVDLRDSEPGEGAEDEVEHVLSDVDHDVFILENAVGHSFPVPSPPGDAAKDLAEDPWCRCSSCSWNCRWLWRWVSLSRHGHPGAGHLLGAGACSCYKEEEAEHVDACCSAVLVKIWATTGPLYPGQVKAASKNSAGLQDAAGGFIYTLLQFKYTGLISEIQVKVSIPRRIITDLEHNSTAN